MRRLSLLLVVACGSCRDNGTMQVNCPEGYTACGAECFNLQNDARHCGSCEHACGNNEECVSGMCQPICGAGQHVCAGRCVSNDSVDHCGTRCTPCPMPPSSVATCDGTRCGLICDPTFRACNGECAACPTDGGSGGFKCTGTQCMLSGCPLGQHLCNGECVDENGGSCGDACLVCPAAASNQFQVCLSGGCEYLCRPGFRACASGCCRADFMEAGGYHSCQLTPAGAVNCWGRGSLDGGAGGALGNNSLLDRSQSVPVTGLSSGVNAVQPGGFHTCAMDQFGAVQCWGWAAGGRLGDGTESDKLTPVPVLGLTAGVAVAVSAGGTGGCALLRSGEVRCWGENAHGEVGDGTSSPRTSPVPVVDLGTSATDVSFGGSHACALLRSRSVRCWGANDRGQLGNGFLFEQHRPVKVTSLADAVRVSAGEQHTCAVRLDGGVVCWGDNSSLQLGLPATEAFKNEPTGVPGLPAAIDVSAGGAHTCALLSGGQVRCWGANDAGQLGDGTTDARAAPMPVTGISDATSISCGQAHACARTQSGTRCWGYNAFGQLGDGTSTNRLTPVMVQ